MNKLQYRSSEAPTPWGMVNVPEEPVYSKYVQHSHYYWQVNKFERAKRDYKEALELALKKWIPIWVEDQEKVAKNIVFKTFAEMANPDESNLYDIPDGMDYELKQVGDAEVFMCATVCAGLTNCRLKSKAEEKKEWRCEGGYKFCQKDDYGNCSCKEEKPKEETLLIDKRSPEDYELEIKRLKSYIHFMAIKLEGVEDTKETESQAELWEEFWDLVYENPDFFDPTAGQSKYRISRIK